MEDISRETYETLQRKFLDDAVGKIAVMGLHEGITTCACTYFSDLMGFLIHLYNNISAQKSVVVLLFSSWR